MDKERIKRLQNLINDKFEESFFKLASQLGCKKEDIEVMEVSLADRKVQKGDEYYYYGPEKLQDNSRPFCIKMVTMSKVFSKDEIDYMSGVLGYDVLKYAGSFNCKHDWVRFRGKRIFTPPVTDNQLDYLTSDGMPFKA